MVVSGWLWLWLVTILTKNYKQLTMSFPVRTVLLLVILLSSASSFSLRLCPYCRAEVEGRAEPSRAVVELLPASGDLNITGSLVLEQGPFGVFFRGEIEGLSPGKHGFHVHQTGDTGNNCKAAGGHSTQSSSNTPVPVPPPDTLVTWAT